MSNNFVVILVIALAAYMIYTSQQQMMFPAVIRQAARSKAMTELPKVAVRFNEEENCYDPYCTDSSTKPMQDRTIGIPTNAQEKIKDFYSERIDDEHRRAHLAPVFDNRDPPSAEGTRQLLQDEINASMKSGTTCMMNTFLRGDSAYPHHLSNFPGITSRDS